MAAGSCFFSRYTSNGTSLPVDCRHNMSAFLSKSHFAYLHVNFKRRSNRAGSSSSPTTISGFSTIPTFCSPKDSKPFPRLRGSHFGNSWLSRSELAHALSRPGRGLAVPSAVDFVNLDTLVTESVSPVLLQLLQGNKILSEISPNSLLYSITFVTAVLGASGVFLSNSTKENGQNADSLPLQLGSEDDNFLDNWLNLSKPSPFNRFVTARCPSLAPSADKSFPCKSTTAGNQRELEPPEYQRFCLHGHDGGTVALDWPCHLDLEKNKELDNVLLIIPGSIEGSEEKGIRQFTRDAEHRGYFPVVMNPRGCGGSPLTTPRVFSAADSDDVRVVANYLAKLRPWATILGVGWGFGANMLSKYLGEEVYDTPLTAAVCIDNPYSLHKVAKSSASSRWNDSNQALTKGLVALLNSNKKLFRGDRKGFDVGGGLAATSLYEFDTAISMVAHGYDTLEKYYEDISSQSTLDKVQIPMLLIQHAHDYMQNAIFLPQEEVERNPYTMVLISPSAVQMLEASTDCPNYPGKALEWSHSIALEWLAAVEVALLKGRHPLVSGVDLTLKPSKEWSRVGTQITATASGIPGSVPATSTFIDAPQAHDQVGGIIHKGSYTSKVPENAEVHERDIKSKSSLETSKRDPSRGVSQDVSRQDQDVVDQQSGDATGEPNQEKKSKQENVEKPSDDVEKEAVSEEEEAERGQVQVAAESVMKVLDVTMPGTLSDEKKQQVLEAVGKGETLVGALQEAVPEDVRDKISGAVSAAVQAQGISLKTAGFGENMPAPKIPAGITESLKARLAGLTGHPETPTPNHDTHGPTGTGSDDAKKVDTATQNDNPVPELEKDKAEQGEHAAHDMSVQNIDSKPTSKVTSDDGKSGDDLKKNGNGVQSEHSIDDGSGAAKTSPDGKKSADDLKDAGAAHTEQESHEGSEASSQKKGDDGTNDSNETQKADAQKTSDEQQPKATESSNPLEHKDEANKQDPTDKAGQNPDTVESKPEGSPPQDQEAQNPQGDSARVDDHTPQTGPQALPPDQGPPVPSVGQALQALTGFDDATQMAVTNVFGVVENVLDQLEKDNPPEEDSVAVAETKVQKPGKKKKSRISSDGLEINDCNTEDNHEKIYGNDSGSDDEHEKEVESGEHTKRDSTTDSHVDTNWPLPRTDSVKDCHDQEDQRDIVPSPKLVRQCDGDPGRHKSGKDPLHAEGVAIRQFADKGEQKFIKESMSPLVNFDIRDEPAQDGKARQHEPQSSVALAVKGREPVQTSSDDQELSHSDSSTNNLNQRRLEAIAAGIDQEDVDNLDKTHKGETGEVAVRDGPNSEGEDEDLVRNVVLNALKLEVVRRLGGAGLDALGINLEKELLKVSHAVSEAVKQGQETVLGDHGAQGDTAGKLGTLNGNNIVKTLGSVLGSPSALGQLVPLGVLVGVVLAALGALFLIVTDDHVEEKISLNSTESSEDIRSSDDLVSENSPDQVSVSTSRPAEMDHTQDRHRSDMEKTSKDPEDYRTADQEVNDSCGDSEEVDVSIKSSTDGRGPHQGRLMGAMAAAMSATAAVASQGQASSHQAPSNVSEAQEHGVNSSGDGDSKPRFVPEIAEKAISMVAPVVPKKEDGEVDQDRLVAMLAEIGQRGGLLTLVGKAALLWGGLRGAMSLADRLLKFLRVRDRPLQQRLLGFLCMAVLLWTPVLVPLLPTLLQQWATKTPNGVADAAAGIGLYGALFILITIWGKRVRGYDRPLRSYGLELRSRAKLRFVAGGMAIGASLVSAFYAINLPLGYVQLSFASVLVTNPIFPGTGATVLLTAWKLLSLVGQSFSMALIVALVEELLFRSWLQEEIAVDLGDNWGILLSALAFAIVHWSPPAMVGLWFLSVALAGARARMGGDLSLPIGLHTGIVGAFSVINLGGFAHYLPGAPAWFTGSFVGNPLAGALGTAMVAALAIGFYPRKQELSTVEDNDHDLEE